MRVKRLAAYDKIEFGLDSAGTVLPVDIKVDVETRGGEGKFSIFGAPGPASALDCRQPVPPLLT